MITPVKEILKMASDANTSVIAFNCVDYNQIYSVIHAAEKVNKPVLCMLYPEHAELNNWCTPESFAAAVQSVAAEVKTPVGLHLDHCQDFNYIIRAIKAGFSCVMYDGSMLPLEENIANTKRVADVAHAFGVAVEAELGHVGLQQLSQTRATWTFIHSRTLQLTLLQEVHVMHLQLQSEAPTVFTNRLLTLTSTGSVRSMLQQTLLWYSTAVAVSRMTSWIRRSHTVSINSTLVRNSSSSTMTH